MKDNLIKTQLAVEIYKIFIEKGSSQKDFAKLIGIRQAKISRIINGHLKEFTIDSLINYLHSLQKYVIIQIVDVNQTGKEF